MKYTRIAAFFSLVLCCLSVPALAEDTAPTSVANHYRIAAGLGNLYGNIGINGEYSINEYVSLSAGLGFARREGPGWALGARLYPLKNDKRFNPRLSGFYGRVATLHKYYGAGGESYEAINGGSLGGGFEWRVYKQLSFDFDLFYVIEDLPAGVKSSHDVSASLGLGVVF